MFKLMRDDRLDNHPGPVAEGLLSHTEDAASDLRDFSHKPKRAGYGTKSLSLWVRLLDRGPASNWLAKPWYLSLDDRDGGLHCLTPEERPNNQRERCQNRQIRLIQARHEHVNKSLSMLGKMFGVTASCIGLRLLRVLC